MMRVPVLLLLTCFFSPAAGQGLLTLEQAIDKALQYNFDIRIAEVELRQAQVNNTAGNAGLLPDIQGTGGVSAGSANTRIEFADGRVQEVESANSISYTAALGVNYTIFAGGRAWMLKKQLGDLETLASVQLKSQIQSVLAQVMQAYALAVWQQQQKIAIDTGLVLAKTRMELSQVQFETGTSAKVNFLQARVDYNARQSDSVMQIAAVSTALADLNLLMGEDPFLQYAVEDSLALEVSLEPVQKELLYQHNLSLEVFRKNVDISLQNEKISRTYLMPTLSFSGNYNYNRTQSQAGFALFNRSTGPSGALNLNVPIFQGGNRRRALKHASLQVFRDELLYDRQATEVGRQYRKAWKDYESGKFAYLLEKQNIEYARENLEIQKARFRVGMATTLEMREAENSYIQALIRLHTAAYQLKIQEVKVLELDNRLVE